MKTTQRNVATRKSLTNSHCRGLRLALLKERVVMAMFVGCRHIMIPRKYVQFYYWIGRWQIVRAVSKSELWD